MTWSGFRPSDDACIYPYLIPSNMFAVVVLGYLVEIAEQFASEAFSDLAEGARQLAQEIDQGSDLRADQESGGRNYFCL